MRNLTLKNIPDDLYIILKRSAKIHQCSINSEILFCLEHTLQAKKISPESRLLRIKALRFNIGESNITPTAIRKAVRSGRP